MQNHYDIGWKQMAVGAPGLPHPPFLTVTVNGIPGFPGYGYRHLL
jgi:hypothetical protein